MNSVYARLFFEPYRSFPVRLPVRDEFCRQPNLFSADQFSPNLYLSLDVPMDPEIELRHYTLDSTLHGDAGRLQRRTAMGLARQTNLANLDRDTRQKMTSGN